MNCFLALFVARAGDGGQRRRWAWILGLDLLGLDLLGLDLLGLDPLGLDLLGLDLLGLDLLLIKAGIGQG
jgi:hypothetical protein